MKNPQTGVITRHTLDKLQHLPQMVSTRMQTQFPLCSDHIKVAAQKYHTPEKPSTISFTELWHRLFLKGSRVEFLLLEQFLKKNRDHHPILPVQEHCPRSPCSILTTHPQPCPVSREYARETVESFKVSNKPQKC